jgi:hypothetical protein
MRDTRARFTTDCPDRGLNRAGLLHGLVGNRHRAVRDGPFKTLQRPCGGWRLFQETPGAVVQPRVQLH